MTRAKLHIIIDILVIMRKIDMQRTIPSSGNPKYAYVLGVSTEAYLPGLLAVLWRMKLLSFAFPVILLIPQGLWITYKPHLSPFVSSVIHFDPSSCKPKEGPCSHWGGTFFKLAIFDIKGYDSLIWLDSDLLLLDNLDHLFGIADMAAVPDSAYGCSDANLCSGMMAFRPQAFPNDKLQDPALFVSERGEAFGDQDIINHALKANGSSFFPLPFKYLVNYLSTDKKLFKSPSCIHFIRRDKPWMWSKWVRVKRVTHIFIHSPKRAVLLLRYIRLTGKAARQMGIGVEAWNE